jgi:hypothetical protein
MPVITFAEDDLVFLQSFPHADLHERLFAFG